MWNKIVGCEKSPSATFLHVIMISRWQLGGGGEAKASPNRAFTLERKLQGLADVGRPETRWANHVQGEFRRKAEGGPNPSELQICGMTCG